MTTTIATHGIYQSVLSFALGVQQKLAGATVQESSGLVSTQAAGLGTSSARMLNLQGELSNAERWSSNASLAGDRVQDLGQGGTHALAGARRENDDFESHPIDSVPILAFSPRLGSPWPTTIWRSRSGWWRRSSPAA